MCVCVCVCVCVHLQGIANGQPHETRVDSDLDFVLVVALDHGKQSCEQDDEVPHELQTNGQPPETSHTAEQTHHMDNTYNVAPSILRSPIENLEI